MPDRPLAEPPREPWYEVALHPKAMTTSEEMAFDELVRRARETPVTRSGVSEIVDVIHRKDLEAAIDRLQ